MKVKSHLLLTFVTFLVTPVNLVCFNRRSGRHKFANLVYLSDPPWNAIRREKPVCLISSSLQQNESHLHLKHKHWSLRAQPTPLVVPSSARSETNWIRNRMKGFVCCACVMKIVCSVNSDVCSDLQGVECGCDAILLGPGFRPAPAGSVRSHSASCGLSAGLPGHGSVPPRPKRSVWSPGPSESVHICSGSGVLTSGPGTDCLTAFNNYNSMKVLIVHLWKRLMGAVVVEHMDQIRSAHAADQ